MKELAGRSNSNMEREELMEFGFFTLTEFFKCNEALFTLSLVMIKEHLVSIDPPFVNSNFDEFKMNYVIIG